MKPSRSWWWAVPVLFLTTAVLTAYFYFQLPPDTQPSRTVLVGSDPDVESPVAGGEPVVPLRGGTIVKPAGEVRGETWTLNALGDVIIGRVVYLKMRQFGINYPFAKMAAEVADADLTLADQESAISDANTVICNTCMSFVSPERVADGLKYAGIDAVSLANNHSYNGGPGGFTDTMGALKRRGIGYFGGGRDAKEAHEPLVLTVKGTKVALLGYNAIVGGYSATADTPGMAEISLAPWEPWDEAEARQMERDIESAAAKADVVLVYYHWGTEYTHQANLEQRQIARRAITAGATVVIGTHPHWVQGIEWYRGKLITYSLGNFVFDQIWRQTQQGTYLRALFAGDKLLRAELVPYHIDDYSQPRPAAKAEAAEILANVFKHSWWPKAK